MTDRGHLELTDPAGHTQRLRLEGRVELGREGGDIVVADPSVSRRHLHLDVTDEGIVITDLGSSNGTSVNGRLISEPTLLRPGDIVLLGDTRISIPAPDPGEMPSSSSGSITPSSVEPQAPAPAPVPAGGGFELPPLPAEFAAITSNGIEVRYRPGSEGEMAAKSVARAAARARTDLAGLGSEPWGAVVVINLVDPFPDPQATDPAAAFVTGGSFVDSERGEIWMVVTAESPAEPPHRVMALLFSSVLPCAAEIETLVEGYGLHLSGAADVDRELAGIALPPLEAATGDLRTLMALSFVRYLIEREGEDTFRRLLAADAGRLEQAVSEMYGKTSTALELGWQTEVAAGELDIESSEFLRLSLRYLKPYKLRQAEIFAYMLLSLAFTSAFPFVTRELFDSAIPSGRFSEVVTLLVILGAAFAVSIVAGLRQAYQSAFISGSVVRDIRQEMFDRLQHIPTRWFGRYPQGDVLSRLFSDVGQVQSGLSDTIGQGIFQAISLVVSAVIMLAVNVWLGLVVLAGAPVVAIVYKTMAEGATTRSLAVQEDNSALFGVAAENYQATAVVKMFGLGGHERARFRRAAERLFRSQVRLSLYGGLFGLSVNMIVTFLRLVVLGLGAWLILEGRFTVGGLVAFLAIMGEVLSPVTVLTTLGQNLQASMGSLVRINEVLDADLEPRGEQMRELPRMRRELRLVDLGFSYTEERRALEGVNAVIPAGSKVAFVGPSGSGKSTVLKMLMRMYEPEEGAVLLDGTDLRQGTLDSLREQMGVVFQDPFLFDTTLRENIALGRPGASDAEIMTAAEMAEIDTFVDRLPRGYDTLVGEGGGNLSGGQRQRVSIARALIRDPQILLLDEATSALDARTERQINATLEKVGAGRTVVAVTHRLTSITGYDKIFVVVEGRIAEEGDHHALVAAAGVYARLWAEQTGAVVPEEAPFDAMGALARIPLFRGLDRDGMTDVSTRLQAGDLAAGEMLAEGEGRLTVISRGRAEALAPGPDGDLVVTAALRPGDAFGLSSLLGAPTGAVLRAIDRLTVLVLDDEALQAVAARHPTVAEALAGRTSGPGPVKGRRVDRSTMAVRTGMIGPVPVRPRAPSRSDIRRMTGAYPTFEP